jgi:small subunit ribosomal protein S17
MPKRILQGKVTSAQNDQTVTVQVERRMTHPVSAKDDQEDQKISRP